MIISTLVLLPGMNGTADLFSEFLSIFDGDYKVISLPDCGSQDHASLAKVIYQQLPNQEFILLAESFSGGIVPELLQLKPTHISGVIFVASFLSSPNKNLLQIAKLLPIKSLVSAPFSSIVYKFLFFGQRASNQLISKFVKVIESIPEQILKSRLDVMSHQQLPQITFDIPAIYIRALSDRLVSAKKSQEVANVFNHIEFVQIEGPHFILQAQPKESAQVVNEAISLILKDSRY